MSTRSNIIIDDGYDRIQIYRHWDGYPNGKWGVLGTLKEALPYAFEFPDFRAKEFASAIVRGWKAKEGNIYIDGSPKGWEMIHGDIEWLYLISPDKRYDVPDGEPIITVFNWGESALCHKDPHKYPPKVFRQFKFSEAEKVALELEKQFERELKERKES